MLFVLVFAILVLSGLPASDPSSNTFNYWEENLQWRSILKKYVWFEDFAVNIWISTTWTRWIDDFIVSSAQEISQASFSYLSSNNIPVNALKEAHEMLWHQQLIHLSPLTLREAHLCCDGNPNISKLTKCTTCLETNQTKGTPSTRSLMESVSHPY